MGVGFGTDILSSLDASQKKATGADVANLPAAENLASQTDSFSESKLLTMLKNMTPENLM